MSKTYIKYVNRNPMWNDGYIHVYIKGEMVLMVSVDDELEKEEYKENDILCVDDLIDHFKEKYSIKKVKRDESKFDWR